MRVVFTNLGCKLNQAEVDSLARGFAAVGHRVVDSLEEADLHVVNSCTVTHVAARDSRKVARRGGRLGIGLRTVLTGCFATEQPEEAAELAGVDLVVPNVDKDALLDKVHEAFPDLAVSAGVPGLPIPYVPLEFGPTRALVKVEDGCDMRCSFCIIPFTRGHQQSREIEAVVAEVENLATAGAREVVITGVQISSYRSGRGERLADLTAALLARTSVPRLRLTSIAPWQFDDRLLELFDDARLCRHVHLSLQSGCTETLGRMRRPYDSADFAGLSRRLRERIAGLAITTDVIVGFPGETEEEFEESLAFVREMSFAKTHVFPFSRRLGTLAAEMPDSVPFHEVRRRMACMLEVADSTERAFREFHLGTKAEVLWEGARKGRWQGMTDNYLRVFARSQEDLRNRLIPTRLDSLVPDGIDGHLLSSPVGR